MDASRLLAPPARYLDQITYRMDPRKELEPVRPYLANRNAKYCPHDLLCMKI